MRHPCATADLDPNNLVKVPVSLIVPMMDILASTTFTGTQDSVSLEFGNGYDMCGPRIVRLVNDQLSGPLKI